MATNVIKIRRTTGSTAPSTLNAGELAFSGGSGTQGNMGQRLFIGDPANSNAVTVIGGNYFSNLMDHAHGTTTASSGLIVDANKSTSELRTGALYLGTSGSDTLITSTAAELNILDGVTSTAAELNILDGVTSTAAELNILDGVTSTAAELNIMDGVTSTAAELNIMDGVTSTAAEINIVDGGTSATSTTLADADRLIVNDNGTMVQVALTDLETYMETSLDTLSNVTSVGTLTALTVDNVAINGTTIGHTGDTDLMTVASGVLTVAGEVDATSLDISGDADIDGTTNLDNTDIDGSLTVDGAIDLNATTLDIDASDDIDIDTSDTTGGIAIGTANSGVPVSIGHSTSEVTVGDNMTITGDLTVSGTTTTVNSTTVSIADPVFEIGASGSDDNLDRGLKMKYNSSGAKIAFMGYDDSDGKFAFIPDATDSSSVFSGSIGTLKANLEGDVTGDITGDITGTAALATSVTASANNSTDETVYPTFVDGATGTQGIETDTGLTYNPSSGILTGTQFTGAVVGNVTGNASGTAATVTGATQAAITSAANLATVGTIGSGTWEGTTVAVDQGGTGLTSASSSGYVMVSNGSAFVMQAIDGGTYS